MGFIQDILKGYARDLARGEQFDIAKAAATAPQVTEVPTALQIGYQGMGGARRKYMGTVDFDTLRSFSVVYDVARACINHRKRQITNLEWAIVPKDDKADAKQYQKAIDQLTEFFEEPVHGNDFKMFVDKIIEDLLVIDGVVLWKDKTFGGGLKELLPVDSATIRLRVSPDGTTPEAPEIAYEQVIYGQVKGQYTTDEMYYKMMNPRNNTPYGLSPLECLVIGVDAALRSQMYNASLLSEGTVPEGFFGLPPEWTPDQIKDYQMWFDAILAGNFNNTSRIKFMPGGKGVGYIPTKSVADMKFLEFEKWLLMKTCAMFDVQPSDLGFIDGMGTNNQSAQQELGNQRGLVPMANFLKQIFTTIIRKDFGNPYLKFEWKGLQVVDDQFELDRSKMMMEMGGMTINELRIGQGLEPLDEEVADMPMVYTTGGPVLLEVIKNELASSLVPKELVPGTGAGTGGATDAAGNPVDTKPADGKPVADPKEDPKKSEAAIEVDELEKWEKKVINALKRGNKIPTFESEKIDRAAQTLINARLSVAKSKEEVRASFAPFKNDAMERMLIQRAMDVRQDISKFKRDRYEGLGSRTK